jgi:hypothetical protein
MLRNRAFFLWFNKALEFILINMKISLDTVRWIGYVWAYSKIVSLACERKCP